MRWRLGWMAVLEVSLVPISLYFLEILPPLHLLGFMNFKIMSTSPYVSKFKEKTAALDSKASDHTDSYRFHTDLHVPWNDCLQIPRKPFSSMHKHMVRKWTKRAALGRFVLQPPLSLHSKFCWANRLCKVTLSAWPSSTGVFLKKT